MSAKRGYSLRFSACTSGAAGQGTLFCYRSSVASNKRVAYLGAYSFIRFANARQPFSQYGIQGYGRTAAPYPRLH
jgi:hypothetical protein